MRRNPDIHRVEDLVADIEYHTDGATAVFASGRRIGAKLIVAADGQRSTVRKEAGIGTRRWTYPQVALTVLLAHERPHHGRSVEFHTRSGPCTLVPLPPRGEAQHRSSLVWLMSPQDAQRRRGLDADNLAAEVAHEAEEIYGEMRLDSDAGFFPMAGMRAARFDRPPDRVDRGGGPYLSATCSAGPKPQLARYRNAHFKPRDRTPGTRGCWRRGGTASLCGGAGA